MSKEDIAKMLYMVRATYPNQYKNINDIQLQNMLDAWYLVFADKDKDLAFRGLQAYLNTDSKGFAPSPGQIIDCMNRLNPNVLPNEMQAWDLVDRAVKNSIYGATEEFNKLPQTIRRVVRNPARLREWATMDIESYMTVEQSNFMRAYRAEKQREEDTMKIPQAIRPALGEVDDVILQIAVKEEREKGFTPDEAIEDLIKALSNS